MKRGGGEFCVLKENYQRHNYRNFIEGWKNNQWVEGEVYQNLGLLVPVMYKESDWSFRNDFKLYDLP